MVEVVVVEVDHCPHRVEERQHGRVAHQRHLVAGDLDRHPGGSERAAQRRDRGASGPHQHRHVVPGDAVLEVRAAEQVGEVLGLGAVGVEGAHHHASVAERTCLGARVGEGRPGRLRDAARQREPPGHPLGGEEQVGAEAPGGAQCDDLGGGAVLLREVAGEVEDAAHLRAAEPVDGLVGIADHGEVAAVTGELPEQGDLARIGVLVLVDEDMLVLRPQLVAVLGRLDRGPPDQVGVVGGAVVVEVLEVLLEEQPGGHELRQPVLDAEPVQLGAVEPLLARPGQHRVDLPGEAAGHQRPAQLVGPGHRLGVVVEQLTQDHVLLRGRQQAQRRGVELRRRVAADEPVGERVERRAQAGRHRATQPGRHPVAQLLGGLAGEGEREDLVGTGATPLDAVDDRLDQGRGLAGAGAGQHQQRSALVVDHALLVVVEHGDLGDHVGAHQAVRRLRGLRGHWLTSSQRTDRALEAAPSPA